MAWILILIAAAAGVANPLQSGANAELNKRLGQPVLAAAWVYASGFLAVLLVVFLLGRLGYAPLQRVSAAARTVPWWAWLGGLISIGPTVAGLTLAQKLGSGVFTTASVAAGILMSMLLDQFGWMGFRQHSASPGRVAGCCLLVVGVWLVARF